MNILCFIHAYPPDHNAGAEWMLHAINKDLISKGHSVKVMTRGGDIATNKNGVDHFRKSSKATSFEGVDLFTDGITQYTELFRWADMVVTHLDRTGKALNLCKHYQKKLVHIVHNTHYNDIIVRLNPLNQYVVYNSDWVKKTLNYPHKNYVLHPPVNDTDYKIKPTGKNITLINCYKPKGGSMLIELAKKFPHRKFVGVLSYGPQEMGDRKNLTYLENTPDIKAVYKDSRLVIMPSIYESFGRVAVEASASGIPVIVTDTPGLKEAMQDGAVYVDKWDNVDQWVSAIKKLDDPDEYKRVGRLGIKRAKELTLQSQEELDGLEKFLLMVKDRRYVQS